MLKSGNVLQTFEKYGHVVFTNRVSQEGNAQAPSVRPFVSILLFEMTDACVWIRARCSQGIEGQGHRSKSSVTPRLRIKGQGHFKVKDIA